MPAAKQEDDSVPAKKYYIRNKIEAEFSAAMDAFTWEKIEDAQKILLPLIEKYGKSAVEDFWHAKIEHRRMGGIGRGRRRSPEQKAVIEQDRFARKTAQTAKTERQKRNHRLIVLGAKLEAAARTAGLNSLQLAAMDEADWDFFFYHCFKNGTKRPSLELQALLKKNLAIKKEEGAE